VRTSPLQKRDALARDWSAQRTLQRPGSLLFH
jgi:hypothetical protein